MKVIMNIVGIHNKVIVLVPNTYTIDKEHNLKIDKKDARKMAIETVCTIKMGDIDIEEVI